MIILADSKDIQKDLKALQAEYGLEEVKIKKDKEEKKAKKAKKETETKKWTGLKGFKKKHKKWFKTKTPAGKDEIRLDSGVAGTIVSLPFDHWSNSRHELWKLSDKEEADLARAFEAAFWQFIPYFIKQYFPIITFCVLYLRMIESKRRLEAQLILNDKLNEFTPRMQKKILKKLGR